MPNRIVRIPSAKAKPHMTRPLRLVQITDTHLFRDQSEDLRGIATLPALRAVLRHAADAIAGADALLVTGDVVQDDAGGYVHFREAFAALGKPVLCIPGNHDDVPEMRRALAAPPFIMDPHVDIGGWRIVLLDSVKAGEASGALSDAACSNIVPGSSPPAPSANQAPATFGEWDKACKEHAPLLFPLAKRFLPTKTRAYESQLEFGGAPRTRACDEIVLDFFRERVCGNMFSYEEIKSTVFEIVVANRASPQLAISDISEGTRTRLDEWVEKYFEDTMRWAEFEGQGCALDGTEYGSDW